MLKKEVVSENLEPKTKLKNSRRRKELWFLAAIFAFPIIHKIIFYIGGNFTSFALAFQEYNGENFVFADDIFVNFKQVFNDFTGSLLLRKSMLNTVYLYIVDTFLGIPIALLCSFFVVKKVPGHGALKIIFFLPSMVSGVVMVLMYQYFLDYAIPDIALNLFGVGEFPNLLRDSSYAFIMMIVYTQWTGFAGGIVLYVGTMTKTGEGVTDAAQIDGVSVMGEFWHVTLPTVYPMLSVFLVTGLMALFTGGGPIFTFYQYSAPNYVYTTGYFLYTKVMGDTASFYSYPYPAAVGIIITLIGAPLTFLLKFLLERFGPSED